MAHPCATASFDIFCIKIGVVILAVNDWKNQKTSRMDGKVMHPQKRNLLSNMDEILLIGGHR